MPSCQASGSACLHLGGSQRFASNHPVTLPSDTCPNVRYTSLHAHVIPMSVQGDIRSYELRHYIISTIDGAHFVNTQGL